MYTFFIPFVYDINKINKYGRLSFKLSLCIHQKHQQCFSLIELEDWSLITNALHCM